MYTARILQPGADLTSAYAVRAAVFVNEQGFSSEVEIDDTDTTAYHVVISDGPKPVATGRVFPAEDDSEENLTYIIGRVAVLKKYRSEGIGLRLMAKLEECAKSLGGSKITLGAQCQAKDFYLKCGYVEFGTQYMDEHCPHIHMKKDL